MVTVDSIEMIKTLDLDPGRRVFPDDRQCASDGDAGGYHPSIDGAHEFDYFPSGLSPVTELAWELGLADPD
jgi:hypothetical protein